MAHREGQAADAPVEVIRALLAEIKAEAALPSVTLATTHRDALDALEVQIAALSGLEWRLASAELGATPPNREKLAAWADEARGIRETQTALLRALRAPGYPAGAFNYSDAERDRSGAALRGWAAFENLVSSNPMADAAVEAVRAVTDLARGERGPRATKMGDFRARSQRPARKGVRRQWSPSLIETVRSHRPRIARALGEIVARPRGRRPALPADWRLAYVAKQEKFYDSTVRAEHLTPAKYLTPLQAAEHVIALAHDVSVGTLRNRLTRRSGSGRS